MMTHTILITGAADRIGAHMAKMLAHDGHNIVIHYHRSAQKAQKLCNEIVCQGQKATLLEADLMDPQARGQLIQKAQTAFGPLSVLINNASIFKPDQMGSLSEDLWHTHFAIHAQTATFLAQDFAAQIPAKSTSHIINMIDQKVWALNPYFFSYTLSKSVLLTATKTMAQALAPHIRVNAIGPGPTLKNTHQTDIDFAREVAHLPLKAAPKLDHIVNTVRFLLSTPSITGQMIAVDGGQHLMWPCPEDDGA